MVHLANPASHGIQCDAAVGCEGGIAIRTVRRVQRTTVQLMRLVAHNQNADLRHFRVSYQLLIADLFQPMSSTTDSREYSYYHSSIDFDFLEEERVRSVSPVILRTR